MRLNTVLSSLLVLGMLTVTIACNVQAGQIEASGGPQAPAASTTTTTDTTGGWIGKTAPKFSLPDANGKTVDVGKVFGTKPVVLVFYRGVWCPFCHAQMAQLGASKEALTKSGAAIFAISNETGLDQKKMQEKHGLDFITFLSDTTGKVGKLYPGLYEGKMVIKPGTYVIGRNKKVIYAYLNEDYRTRAQTDAVLEALKKAQ